MRSFDSLTMILRTLPLTIPDLEATIVVNAEGSLLATSRRGGLRAIPRLALALLRESKRLVTSIGRGTLEVVMVRDSEGFTIFTPVEDSIVIVETSSTVDFDCIVRVIQRIARLVIRLRRTDAGTSPDAMVSDVDVRAPLV